MIKTIQKFISLTSPEKRIVFRALQLLMLYPLLRRMLDMPKLVAFYDNPPPGILRGVSPERLLELVQMILRIRIRPLHPNCMKQSLVMYHFLRSENYPVSLCFGVAKKPDGNIDGHAWISLNNQPFGEKDDPLSKFRISLQYPLSPDPSPVKQSN